MCEHPTCILEDCEIPYGYCHCGCGEKTNISKKNLKAHGWVKGVPMRYICGHSHRQSPVNFIVNEETKCWEWLLNKNILGYGSIKIKGKNTLAHRYYYEQKYGKIPEGLVLDHICRNSSCVNPDHLEPVTSAENCRRGSNSKLNWEKVGQIRKKFLLGLHTRTQLAQEYLVSKATISRVINQKIWNNTEQESNEL